MLSIDSVSAYPAFGSLRPSFRRPTRGPEYDLAVAFAERCLPSAPPGQQLEVFLEPRLPSGFPDVVAVYWSERAAARAPDADLALNDIRLLHHLSDVGSADRAALEMLFGPSLRRSLMTLIEAGFVSATARTYKAAPLRETFAVTRLVSIEAKVRDWQRGLRQATINTWFASESYLLLGRLPNDPRLSEVASREGIGVLTPDNPLENPVIRAQEDSLPKSYAAWLFNLWACRVQQSRSLAS
jgi:hypothetical protein